MQLMFSDIQVKKFLGKKWRIILPVTNVFTDDFLCSSWYHNIIVRLKKPWKLHKMDTIASASNLTKFITSVNMIWEKSVDCRSILWYTKVCYCCFQICQSFLPCHIRWIFEHVSQNNVRSKNDFAWLKFFFEK